MMDNLDSLNRRQKDNLKDQLHKSIFNAKISREKQLMYTEEIWSKGA